MLTRKSTSVVRPRERDRLTGSGPGRHPTGVPSDDACCRVFKDRRASAEGSLPHDAPSRPEDGRSRTGPASIALERRAEKARSPLARPARQCSRPGPRQQSQESTWTVTVRSRSRSSKSRSTTCCHVPSTRRPATMGIDTEGPTIAARMCAWALVS